MFHLLLPACAASVANFALPQENYTERFGATLHFGDFDRDGAEDIYVTDPVAGDRLLHNRGGGLYEDVTAAHGLDADTRSLFALWFDLDADGARDLCIGGLDGSLRLLQNADRGHFVDVTPTTGLQVDAVGLDAEARDLDGDGRIDLHVTTELGGALFRNAGAGRFERLRLPDVELDALLGAAPTAEMDMTTGLEARLGTGIDQVEGDTGRSASRAAAARARRSALAARLAAANTGAPGNAGTSSTVPGPPTTSSLLTSCTTFIDDHATANCIRTSSVPTLGMLFPLSTELFVATNGRVGMGTSAPSAGLHIVNHGGLLAVGTLGVGTISAQGAGTRLMWHSAKGALRAGDVSSTQWDDANIGLLSTALGDDTRASGDASFAAGRETEALGWSSFAGGYRSDASGSTSIALGHSATASGFISVALGNTATASGASSFAAGFSGVASGAASCALGNECEANSHSSFAAGAFNIGGGDPSNWVDSDPLFEIGNGLSEFNRSNALTVLKNGSVGIGTATPATRLHVRTGSALGATPSVNAQVVLERDSHSYMQFLTPNARESGLVFGNPADESAGGIYYNSTVANGLTFRCNGNSTKLVLDQSGRLGVGTSAPATLLHLAQPGGPIFRMQDLDAGGPTYHFGIAGSDDSLRISETGVADRMVIARTTGNVGIGTASPSFLLHVNGSAGKPGGGSWSVASDARLKTNVRELDGALAKLLALRGVTYEYVDPAAIGELTGERTGFLAQEVEEVCPDWVEEGADGYKRLSIRGFEALTVEALRELRAEKDERIAALERRLDEQAALLKRLADLVDGLAE